MTIGSDPGKITVRSTQITDCHLLPAIERSAARVFASDPALSWLAQQDPIEPHKHFELIKSGACFVAVAGDDRRCGFVATEVVGTDLHIWELSVDLAYQQRGIGRQLLGAAEQAAMASGLQRLTLTTFRDLEWNGPFYQRCGFTELTSSAPNSRLSNLLAAEVRNGLPAGRRCAMEKLL